MKQTNSYFIKEIISFPLSMAHILLKPFFTFWFSTMDVHVCRSCIIFMLSSGHKEFDILAPFLLGDMIQCSTFWNNSCKTVLHLLNALRRIYSIYALCNHFPHVFQQGGLVSNRDNRNKQGGLGARPNVFLHAAAHARIVPLKSDKKK